MRMTWNETEQDLIEWYQLARLLDTLPREPFQRAPGVRVAEPSKFYARLDGIIKAGPGSPQHHTGSLADDLRTLREREGANE